MNIFPKSNRPSRTGAAFLLLIVMVLLVVVGATQTLVRSELTTRRSESERIRLRSMVSAIDVVRQFAEDSTDPVRLPLDESGSEFIELTIDTDPSQITARWFKGQQVIDEMRQAIQQKVESSE